MKKRRSRREGEEGEEGDPMARLTHSQTNRSTSELQPDRGIEEGGKYGGRVVHIV